jgi:hypothetical protein
MHHLEIGSVDQMDEEVRAWLREASGLGEEPA